MNDSSIRDLHLPYQAKGFSAPRRISIKKVLSYGFASIAFVVTSYACYAWSLDQESLAMMKSLDFPTLVPKEYFGTKVINRWGKLERRGVLTTCGALYSELDHCNDNAVLHTNCLPICESWFSGTCSDSCTALQTEHDFQLTNAQAHCTTKSKAKCDLHTRADGSMNYYDFYDCCTNAVPVGPPSCLCDNQHYAGTSCLDTTTGTCTDSSICLAAPSVKCTGSSSAASSPLPENCGLDEFGHQTYRQMHSFLCSTDCDEGTPAQDYKGNYICSDAQRYDPGVKSNYVAYDSCVSTDGGPFPLPVALWTVAANGSPISPDDCIQKCEDNALDLCGFYLGTDCYGGTVNLGNDPTQYADENNWVFIDEFFCTTVSPLQPQYWAGGFLGITIFDIDLA